VKNPLKRLGVGAQPTVVSSWSSKLDWDRIAKARRKAGIATAVAAVVSAGTASSLFVDYLADRAIERGASLARIAAAQTEVASNEPQVGEPMETLLPETTSVSASMAAAPSGRTVVTPAQAGVATAGALPDRSADPATDGEQIFAYANSDDALDGPSAVELAAGKLAGDDRMFTSAIPLPETAPPPAPNPTADKLAAIKASAPAAALSIGGQAGRTTQAVTMRAGPAKRAGQIAVVPAKSPVTVLGCKSWCEIVYNGKRGFVYKRFVRNS
jgi:hypothetical protein